MNALVIPQFTPSRAIKGGREQQREAAALFRTQLVDLLDVRGPMKVTDLAELTGASQSTIRDYLQKMVPRKVLEATRIRECSGQTCCVYGIAGDKPTAREWSPNQRTVTKWKPEPVKHHEIHAAFFAKQKR